MIGGGRRISERSKIPVIGFPKERTNSFSVFGVLFREKETAAGFLMAAVFIG